MTTTEPDCLMAMFADLRAAIPTGEPALTQYFPWLHAMAQVITFFPTERRQTACVYLVANDMCLASGKPITDCCTALLWAIELQKAGKP